jgi:Regulator of chromosome condensation (RCC1) repeat/Fibronectin type III domain
MIKKRIQCLPRRLSGLAVCGLFLWLAGFSFSAHAQAIPNAPTNLPANTVLAGQINLTWSDNSTNEDGFKIERSTDGTNFTQVAQVLPNTTVYRNTGLWPGMAYYYRVRAYNSIGDSPFSDVANAATPALCPASIVSWGWNFSNQVTVPPGVTGVVMMAVGYHHNLVLEGDGTIVGWGDNSIGATTPPAGLTGVVALSAGYNFSLALKSDGTAVAWGDNTYYGQATPPVGLSNVVAISAGQYYGLALKSDGTVIGWGRNTDGEATPPTGLTGVVAIAAGPYHALALKSDGTVVGWGHDYQGETTIPAGLTGVIAVSAGYEYSLALKSDGTVVGWGYNYDGQATPPVGLSNVVAIAAGYWHALALKSDGTVVAWGSNFSGASTPPNGLTNVIAQGAGVYDSLVLTSPCVLGAPSALTAATVTASQIDLHWTDNSSGEDRFGIERAASSTGPWAEIGSVDFDVTTYSDTGLNCGQTYFYRVRAYKGQAGSAESNTANANTSPNDTDCDGIPNSWMQQYFGHATGQESDNSRATDDADGDGQKNLAEFMAGTDPTNSASAFRILEIAALDEDMLLTWNAVGGKWYIVQTTTNFTGSLSNSFYDLNPLIIAPGMGEFPLSVLHLGAATNAPVRLYRVRLAP